MKKLATLITTVLALLGNAKISSAGPTVTVGMRVSPSQIVPAEQISHSAWNTLLKKYVDAAGMVDYRTWKATAEDLLALDNYLNHLSTATFTQQTKPAVRLAYWINAYNAVTVKGILREYPTTSIKNHDAKVIGYKIWDDLQLLVANQPYSLNHMEHKLLRKMNEPRIHFAIVCASKGCPRLLNEAYLADKLENQLTSNAQIFFANESNFKLDAAQSTIYLSKIIQWFGKDFGRTSAEQMRRLAPWLPKAARSLANSGGARIRYLEYDWDLNDRNQSARQALR